MVSSKTVLQRPSLHSEKKCRVDLEVSEAMSNPPRGSGPLLMYVDTDARNQIWKGSLLFFARADTQDPALAFDENDEHDEVRFYGGMIDSRHGYRVFRWRVFVRQSSKTRRIRYIVTHEGKRVRHSFYVAGVKEAWRFAVFSCNGLSHTSGYKGYSEKYGGILPLWADVLHKHGTENFHVMFGIGDQIYMDCVWEHTKSLDRWTRIPSRAKRETMSAPKDMEDEVDSWVFFFYLCHFREPVFAQALATIPYSMMTGDHDFVDGFGSYPEDLENCPVMRAYKRIVIKYYLLFQLHVVFDDQTRFAESDDKYPYFGNGGFSFLKNLGDHVRVLAFDTRLERSRKQIVSQTTYDEGFDRLRKNFVESPTKPLHLIVIVEIPMIIPDLKKIERIFDYVSRKRRGKFLTKIGKRLSTFKWLGFPFAEPVLLTDMIDHWNSTYHMKERTGFLERLQAFSSETNVRVTFVSGDVHVAGIGRFATPSNSKDKQRAHYESEMLLPFDFATDNKLMYQIITSAIGNVPPANWVVKMYHIIDNPEIIHTAQGDTDARMLRFFRRSAGGQLLGKKSKKLMNLRNWCSVKYMDTFDSLFFQLHVELFMGAGRTTNYYIGVPPVGADRST